MTLVLSFKDFSLLIKYAEIKINGDTNNIILNCGFLNNSVKNRANKIIKEKNKLPVVK